MIRISKNPVNIREKLAELERPIGINGQALLATDTPQQAFDLLGARNRNLIINGGMVIDQRNAGAAITGITGGNSYAVDRFATYNQSSGNYTAQQVSDGPTGFKNSLKVTIATAASSATSAWTSFILQYIEGFNTANLNGGTSTPSTVTLSFWVKSSITGIMPLCINNDASRQYNTTYSIDVANTWEKKFVTLTLDTAGTWNSTNGRGLGIAWGLGSGSSFTNSTLSTLNTWQGESALPNFYYSTSNSVQFGTNLNATFQITGVQLEVGKVATPFEYRSYGQELALCQRYFYNTARAQLIYGRSWGSGIGTILWKHLQNMRVAPTMTFTDYGNMSTISDNNTVFCTFSSSATGAARDIACDITITSAYAEL